jgi:hypothetical protein
MDVIFDRTLIGTTVSYNKLVSDHYETSTGIIRAIYINSGEVVFLIQDKFEFVHRHATNVTVVSKPDSVKLDSLIISYLDVNGNKATNEIIKYITDANSEYTYNSVYKALCELREMQVLAAVTLEDGQCMWSING